MSIPLLPFSITPPSKLDSLHWTDEASFAAFGLRFGLRTNDAALLAQSIRCAPISWQPTSILDVDVLYSIYRESDSHPSDAGDSCLLYCDAELVLNTQDRGALLSAFENHAQLLTAYRAQDCLFVHAGVVGQQRQAILIPGRSMTGKTSLVKALVEAGAVYYSDEFAVLDKAGLVHPYPRPLSIRGKNGQPRKTPVEALGGQTGVEPLPVGLIIVTEYQPDAVWRPRKLPPGQSLLALMDNTIAAQGNPSHSMPILKQAVTGAIALKSKRGEAGEVAPRLLTRLEKSL